MTASLEITHTASQPAADLAKKLTAQQHSKIETELLRQLCDQYQIEITYENRTAVPTGT